MRTITKPTTVYKVPVSDLMSGRDPRDPILPVEIHCPQDCRPIAVYDNGHPDVEYADVSELLEDHNVNDHGHPWELLGSWERYQATTDVEVES